MSRILCTEFTKAAYFYSTCTTYTQLYMNNAHGQYYSFVKGVLPAANTVGSV